MAPRERGHRRQKSQGHGEGPIEVDGQVAFEHGRVGQIVAQHEAGVVDQHVQCLDLAGSCPNLRRAGDVQSKGRHPVVWVGQRLSGAGIHSLGASRQGFGCQCLPNAAVGPGHQDCLVFMVMPAAPVGSV